MKVFSYRLPPMHNQSLLRKVLIIALLPLVFNVFSVCFLILLLHQAEVDAERERASRSVIEQTMSAGRKMSDLVMVCLTMIIDRNGDRALAWRRHEEDLRKASANLKLLRKQAEAYPELRPYVTRVEVLDTEFSNLVDELLVLMEWGGGGSIRMLDVTSRLAGILTDMAQLMADCRRLLAECRATGATLSQSYRLIALGFIGGCMVGNVFLSMWIARFVSEQINVRVKILLRNANLFAAAGSEGSISPGQRISGLIPGSDEIAQLDAALRNMAVQLEESKRKERALVENALSVIFSLDEKLRFTSVSPASQGAWGIPCSDLIGTAVLNLLQEPDTDTLRTAFKTAITSQTQVTLEAIIRRKNGYPADVLWSIKWSPTRAAFFCVCHDISSRKRAESLIRASESRIKLIMDRMPEGLCVTDASGSIKYLNSSARRLFGCEANETIMAPLTDFIRMPGTPIDNLSFQWFIENSPSKVSKADIINKNGTFSCKAQISIDTHQFLTESRSATKLQHSLQDNNLHSNAAGSGRRKMLNLQSESHYLVIILNISERAALLKSRAELISMIARDIRAPLNSISIVLSLLRNGNWGELTEKGTRKIAIAEKESQRLSRLFDDFLAVEKFDHRFFDLELEQLALRDIIEQSIQSVRTQSKAKSITMVTQPEDLHCIGDRDRLTQVLVNLLSNAVKYSPQGGSITIYTRCDGNHIGIAVLDEGPGIPEGKEELIFQTFKQLNLEDATTKGGTGLGLSICRAIVESHGGKIGVENAPTGGALFWFRLPLHGAD